jgi:predicted metal-dependent phosphoesterase TrpH
MTFDTRPSPFVDLHVHTTCSDGIYTPRQVVQHAQRLGIEYLAITDHDTFTGTRDALSIAEELPDPGGPTVIPGIEVSCMHDQRDVHMLGYYCTAPTDELAEVLEASREQRTERARTIVGMMETDGYPISENDFEDQDLTFNRVNIARILLHRGCIPSVDHFFKHLVGKGGRYHVARHEIEPAYAIKLIRDSGGLPVIAHPAHYHVVDLIAPLIKDGLAGVEAYHASHPISVARELEAYATSAGLLVTGGSDWHGDATHASELGIRTLPRTCLERFIAADPRPHGPRS